MLIRLPVAVCFVKKLLSWAQRYDPAA